MLHPSVQDLAYNLTKILRDLSTGTKEIVISPYPDGTHIYIQDRN